MKSVQKHSHSEELYFDSKFSLGIHLQKTSKMAFLAPTRPKIALEGLKTRLLTRSHKCDGILKWNFDWLFILYSVLLKKSSFTALFYFILQTRGRVEGREKWESVPLPQGGTGDSLPLKKSGRHCPENGIILVKIEKNILRRDPIFTFLV